MDDTCKGCMDSATIVVQLSTEVISLRAHVAQLTQQLHPAAETQALYESALDARRILLADVARLRGVLEGVEAELNDKDEELARHRRALELDRQLIAERDRQIVHLMQQLHGTHAYDQLLHSTQSASADKVACALCICCQTRQHCGNRHCTSCNA